MVVDHHRRFGGELRGRHSRGGREQIVRLLRIRVERSLQRHLLLLELGVHARPEHGDAVVPPLVPHPADFQLGEPLLRVDSQVQPRLLQLLVVQELGERQQLRLELVRVLEALRVDEKFKDLLVLPGVQELVLVVVEDFQLLHQRLRVPVLQQHLRLSVQFEFHYRVRAQWHVYQLERSPAYLVRQNRDLFPSL